MKKIDTSHLKTTKYYDEYIRYYGMAKTQQEECNLGLRKHIDCSIEDDLMKHVELYDVVNRRYAGFSQACHDIFYGWTEDHPYYHKMEAGIFSHHRDKMARDWTGKNKVLDVADYLYLFLLHRVTGSGIHYAYNPSGYYNTILFDLHQADTIEHMTEIIKGYQKPFYVSVGYQFPQFPKPTGTSYKRGGDYYLCEFAPKLCRELAVWLQNGGKKDMRQIGDWMFDWNKRHGLKMYRFQYAAFIADVADWYPEFVNLSSLFYYGTNAKECLSYLAEKPTGRVKGEEFLDSLMRKIYEDTGANPYDAEDVACDFIRWVENYIKPGADYSHIDMDKIWNSSTIRNHPYGRQKAMLELGLVKTFNDHSTHPSDDKIIKLVGLTEAGYKDMVSDCLF
jgi:hypothetical protein